MRLSLNIQSVGAFHIRGVDGHTKSLGEVAGRLENLSQSVGYDLNMEVHMNYIEIIIGGIVGAILGALMTCWISNYTEKKKSIYDDNKNRCSILIDFIMFITRGVREKTYDEHELIKLQDAVVHECLIYGSHKLIKKWNKLFQNLINPTATIKDKLYCVEDVMVTLRKDCGYIEKIQKGELLMLLGITDLKK